MNFVLTDENYYSREADMAYMSCSQFQGFAECEAKALAKLQGRWTDEEKEAFLVGNYFHSYFESPEAHKKFCDDHFDSIFKTKDVTIKRATKDRPAIKETVITGKYAPYEMADKMIRCAESDPVIKRFIDMDGNCEQFMTGEVFGFPWRMKMDKYMPQSRMIIDYKTVANIRETKYDPEKGGRVTFVEGYGYIFRAAVYSMIECQNVTGETFSTLYNRLKSGELSLPNFVLICISKQDYPDKELVRLNHKQAYIYELEAMKDRLYRYQSIKEGRAMPKRCGLCDYCRATKKITGIKPYYELNPEYRTEREEDYALREAEAVAET
jgi:hypothetical protein